METLKEIKDLSEKIIADKQTEARLDGQGIQQKQIDEERAVSVMAQQEGFEVFKKWIEERIYELMLPVTFPEGVDVYTRCLEHEKRSAIKQELAGLLLRVERAKENIDLRKQGSEKGI